MKVALYVYLSTSTPSNKEFIKNQLDHLYSHCRVKNYEIKKVYQDIGKRKELKELLDTNGMYDRVIVYDASRLSLEKAEYNQIREKLKKINVTLECIISPPVDYLR